MAILTPSGTAAKEWTDVAEYAEKTKVVSEKVAAMQAGDFFGPLVLANRYDGIDLAGNACRFLVMDTPGEVMQLPQDEALVLVSGLQPIRAKKLRYYEDSNFNGRVLPPPVLNNGDFADAPPHQTHDWEGQVRAADTRLEKPWFAVVQGGDGEEGGLTRELWNEAAPPASQDVRGAMFEDNGKLNLVWRRKA